MSATRLAHLRDRTDAMVEHLETLVTTETPSEDLDACVKGADVVSTLFEELLDTPATVIEVGGRPHLRATWDADPAHGRVLLLGHFDTVWPMGTLTELPFTYERSTGISTGP